MNLKHDVPFMKTPTAFKM